jgi:hypothetical protein
MGTGTLVNLLILLAVLAIVVVAGYFILSQIQLPPPIQKIILILLVAVVAIIAIIILLNLGGVTHIGTRSHALLGEHYSQVAPLPPIPPGPPPICQGC